MTKTSFQKQLEKMEVEKAKLQELESKIKLEKDRIDSTLGNKIISETGIDYAVLDRDKISELAQKFSDFYNRQN